VKTSPTQTPARGSSFPHWIPVASPLGNPLGISGYVTSKVTSVRGPLEQREKNAWRAKVCRTRSSRTTHLTRTIRGNKRVAEDALRDLLTEAGRGDQVATEA
jgi:hypothetical protein